VRARAPDLKRATRETEVRLGATMLRCATAPYKSPTRIVAGMVNEQPVFDLRTERFFQ
jgi:hypothetical protein